MRAEMERCAREGTPRPESSAVRAHVPAAFWFFANSWRDLFRNGVVDHAIKELCRVYISRTRQVRVLRQPALREGPPSSGLVEGQYDELLNFESSDAFDERQKAALAYAEAIAWHLETDDAFWERHARALQRARAGRARLHDRPDARPAELAAAAQHRPPPGACPATERLDGARLRDAPRRSRRARPPTTTGRGPDAGAAAVAVAPADAPRRRRARRRPPGDRVARAEPGAARPHRRAAPSAGPRRGARARLPAGPDGAQPAHAPLRVRRRRRPRPHQPGAAADRARDRGDAVGGGHRVPARRHRQRRRARGGAVRRAARPPLRGR